jgi:hypothetical protein
MAELRLFAKENMEVLKYLPEEVDWPILDRQWFCDILLSVLK